METFKPDLTKTPPNVAVTGDAEEFMAILMYCQSEKSTCNCPAAKYFKKIGNKMIKDKIKVVENE